MSFDPKRIEYDADGIPVFTAATIEAIATELLTKYCPHVLEIPKATPVLAIIDRLKETTRLQYCLNDLGTRGDRKILGKVNFRTRTLSLDKSLIDSMQQSLQFTAAHEIGHWILHRYRYKSWKLDADTQTVEEIADDESSLFRLDSRSPREWLEFHANVFAASLIMPRKTFREALIRHQSEMGITKNLGIVFVNDENYSQADMQRLVGLLRQTFEVSKQSVRVRFDTLKLLEDETRPSSFRG